MAGTKKINLNTNNESWLKLFPVLLDISHKQPVPYKLEWGKTSSVGHSLKNKIKLKSSFVSNNHFSIRPDNPKKIVVTDKKSTNGTYINGKKLVGSKSIEFDTLIRIGNIDFLLIKGYEDTLEENYVFYEFGKIVGKSNKMLRMFRKIAMYGRLDANLLIIGSTGTGKELIARAVAKVFANHTGCRKYIAVNCSSLNSEILESELFGHVKGAFTGATLRKQGILEKYSNGLIFLDETGNMSMSTQEKLLRVVEYGEVKAVGSNKTYNINTRFIFATNRKLESLVSKNLFKQDFYYRISGLKIISPNFSAQKSDLEAVIKYFLWQKKVLHFSKSISVHSYAFFSGKYSGSARFFNKSDGIVS